MSIPHLLASHPVGAFLDPPSSSKLHVLCRASHTACRATALLLSVDVHVHEDEGGDGNASTDAQDPHPPRNHRPPPSTTGGGGLEVLRELLVAALDHAAGRVAADLLNNGGTHALMSAMPRGTYSAGATSPPSYTTTSGRR